MIDYDVTKGTENNINPRRLQQNEDNQINKISKITEKDQNLSLTDNISGDDSSDYDSPGWSECKEYYGPKNEFCDLCGFHTRCLKSPLARIPARNWYCMRCSKKLKCKTQSDNSNSSDNNVEVTEPTDDEVAEPTDDEVVNNRQSKNAENECIPSTSTNNEQYNKSYKECDDELSQQIYDNEEGDKNISEEKSKHKYNHDSRKQVKGNQKKLFESNFDSDSM
ncbi:11930_t:CDS:2 [Cetraspora pellucida]|uniref:11930_t:CDS:1 n=1 Tax=Cetraspora pellucida TaxID=1433469 RepID=A0ACA9LXN4_9GLOM|nr:11930_t:CDS:2 [Cetraspora pellucida]